MKIFTDRLINEAIDFARAYQWFQRKRATVPLTIKRHHYFQKGTLYEVDRLQAFGNAHPRAVFTLIYVAHNQSAPYLFVFGDSLQGLGIRNLTHRIQILSCDRQPTFESNLTPVEIHLIGDYDLQSFSSLPLAKTILLYVIRINCDSPYFQVNWEQEIEFGRLKFLKGKGYTMISQEKARILYSEKLNLISAVIPRTKYLPEKFLYQVKILKPVRHKRTGKFRRIKPPIFKLVLLLILLCVLALLYFVYG